MTLATGLVVTPMATSAAAMEPAASGTSGCEVAEAERSHFDTDPAKDALKRLLGDRRASQFLLRSAARNGPGDRFTVCAAYGGRIVVRGTSNGTLLTGVNRYLKQEVKVGIGWNGASLSRLPGDHSLPPPATTIDGSTPFPHRFANNDVMSSYTGPYWTWEDWEREIDELAANGINEVLVYPGQAMVFYQTMLNFGYSDEELRAWIPQPAHQVFWLNGRMSNQNEPISMQLLKSQAELGRRIADRVRELGMTPVFRGYYGYVPADFADKNPGAHVIRQGRWHGGNIMRLPVLNPTGAHFEQVASAFYRAQDSVTGATSMYKMDPGHEGGHLGDVDLGEAARAIQAALTRAHPDAIWVILGWTNQPSRELLRAVDRSKVLVIDGISDKYPDTNREAAWEGTPYTYGTIWNFGGRTLLGANTGAWVRDFPQWAAKPTSALSGISLMPESNDNNPFAMALLTDLAWYPEGIEIEAWTRDFATWRYGGADPHAQRAWQIIRSTAYSTSNDGAHLQRQSNFTAHNVLGRQFGARYDIVAFSLALPELLRVDPSLRDSSAYRYDVVDVARQVLTNHAVRMLPEIEDSYQAEDRARFTRLTQRWLQLMRLMNKLLLTNESFLLGPWIDQARAAGADEAESDMLEYHTRTFLTNFVTDRPTRLKNYANRDKAGLFLHYRERWRLYFESLDTALETGRQPEPIDWYAVNDAWAKQTGGLASEPVGDSYKVAEEVLHAVAEDPILSKATATTSPRAVQSGATTTLKVTFRNGSPTTAATATSVTLEAPDGVDVEPSRVDLGTVDAGDLASAEFAVRLPADYPLDDAIEQVDIAADVSFSYGSSEHSLTEVFDVLVNSRVQPPYETASFNDAVFGQRGDRFAIHGAGSHFFRDVNEFGTIFLPDALTSGFRYTTRVVSQDDTHHAARAGIVARNSLADNGSLGFADIFVTPGRGCIFEFDSDGDGTLDKIRRLRAGVTAPAYVRLTRTGDTFTGACSYDGETWMHVGSATLPEADTVVDVGLVQSATNQGSGEYGMAVFEGFVRSSVES